MKAAAHQHVLLVRAQLAGPAAALRESIRDAQQRALPPDAILKA